MRSLSSCGVGAGRGKFVTRVDPRWPIEVKLWSKNVSHPTGIDNRPLNAEGISCAVRRASAGLQGGRVYWDGWSARARVSTSR